MEEEKSESLFCDRCEKEIKSGKAYIAIVRNVEHSEFNVMLNAEEIEVVHSEQLITFCGSCGNKFNAQTILQIINAIPLEDSGIRN